MENGMKVSSGHKNEARAGKSDEEIHRITDALTQDGYTVAETRKDVQPMIDGARSKPFASSTPTQLMYSVSLQRTITGNMYLRSMNLIISR